MGVGFTGAITPQTFQPGNFYTGGSNIRLRDRFSAFLHLYTIQIFCPESFNAGLYQWFVFNFDKDGPIHY